MDFMYRIENENGLGPYSGEVIYINGRNIGMLHSYDNGKHPSWNEEEYEPELYEFHKNASFLEMEKRIFGFDTIKQYCEWFTREERKIMFEHGLRLKKIKVKDKIVGRKQCIAIRAWLLIRKLIYGKNNL